MKQLCVLLVSACARFEFIPELFPCHLLLRARTFSSLSARDVMELKGDSKVPTVIFVLGPPGSGKGTQCSLLSKTFSFIHLSAGELIRTQRDTPNSIYGKRIAEAIKEPGKFVPSEITCQLLESAMEKSGGNRFLFDAFPINSSNLEVWEQRMASKVNTPFLLFFEISEDESLRRCESRQREDDTELVLRKRFEAYLAQTKPLVQQFEKRGLLYRVDGSRDIQDVFSEVSQIFRSRLPGLQKGDSLPAVSLKE